MTKRKYSRKPLKERFESKYEVALETGCWDWTASTINCGYGQFKADGKMVRAHRVSYELYKGLIPEGLCVLHKCNNRKCVNPDHLFLGSKADNMSDKVAKNRQSRLKGSENGNSKLTALQVIEIRELYARGNYTQEYLGKMSGVTNMQISNIVTRKKWGHL